MELKTERAGLTGFRLVRYAGDQRTTTYQAARRDSYEKRATIIG